MYCVCYLFGIHANIAFFGFPACSPLSDAVIECHNCATRNVFLMGFCPAEEDNVVVLLCRGCLNLGSLKQTEWNLNLWQPLIKDRAFVDWLVQPPEEIERMRAHPITSSQIASLEELWRTKPDANLEDLDTEGVEEDVEPVQLQYEDAYHYQNVLGPLVKMEADEDRRLTESLRKDGKLHCCDNFFPLLPFFNGKVNWCRNHRTMGCCA